MTDELKMLREDVDSLTETLNSMSKLVLAHDDTLTRLYLIQLMMPLKKQNKGVDNESIFIRAEYNGRLGYL